MPRRNTHAGARRDGGFEPRPWVSMEDRLHWEWEQRQPKQQQQQKRNANDATKTTSGSGSPTESVTNA